jgi:hypothetical protein
MNYGQRITIIGANFYSCFNFYELSAKLKPFRKTRN